MAEMEPCGSVENKNNTTFLPGYADANGFTQEMLKTVLQATKSSNDLPPAGDDFDYYSSYEGFRDLMAMEGQRILHLIQSIMKHQNVKGNLSRSADALDLEDKLDILMDANDQILERVGNWLDEAAGIKRTDTSLVVATAQQTSAASWNKKTSSPKSNSMSSYRLLAARNIQRPQLKFKDKIDNSARPFIPKIKEKPNALKSLEESLVLPSHITPEQAEETDLVYPHPYQFELDQLKHSERDIIVIDPKEAAPLEDTPLSLITTQSQLESLCSQLKAETEIAVDLEHHSYRSFQGFTCLMQISTRAQDFLVDTIELRTSLHCLNSVFTDPKIVKVFHGAESDICWLQRDFGLYVVNMFDTGQAARILGFSRLSLAYLLQFYCHLEADKQYQLADWRIRPLPQELQKYAREDTHYLLYIYDRMKNTLLERGNEQKNLLMSVLQRSTQICAKVYKKPQFKEEDYHELFKKHKKVFNSRQLLALRKLYSWRDKVARMEDESVAYVLPNHMLLQICDILPRERQGVFACCNPIPPLVRQYLTEIHFIVMEAREAPLVKSKPLKSVDQPSISAHPKYDVNSLLNCPHDLSYPSKNLQADSMDVTPDTTLLKANSTLFKSEMTFSSLIVVKNKPILTIFDVGKTMKAAQSTGQRTADLIKSTFVSPLEMFLPSTEKKMTVSPSKDKNQNAGSTMRSPPSAWKLLAHTTVKRKIEGTDAINDNDDAGPAPKRNKSEVADHRESDEEDTFDTPIQFQLPPRKTKLKFDEAEDTEPKKEKEKRNIVESRGKIQNEIDTSVEVADGQSVKKKKKKKKKEKLKEIDNEEFVPYDYSHAGQSKMQENPEKKLDYFDPHHQFQHGKGPKVKKPHTSSNKSKKSYTFGTHHTRGDVRWPKT